jgi:hypothetical protein
MIMGTSMGEVTRDWRKLYNEEFYNLCTSPNIVGIIKSEE